MRKIIPLCFLFLLYISNLFAQDFEGVVYYSLDENPGNYFGKKVSEIDEETKENWIPFYFSGDKLKFEYSFVYIYKNGYVYSCAELLNSCDSSDAKIFKKENTSVKKKKEIVQNYLCSVVEVKSELQTDIYWYCNSLLTVNPERYSKYGQTSLGPYFSHSKNIPLKILLGGRLSLTAVCFEEVKINQDTFNFKIKLPEDPLAGIDFQSRSINLSHKSLHELPKELYYATSLESLDVSACDLFFSDWDVAHDNSEHNPTGVFSQLKNLTSLNLSFNPLIDISPLPVLPKLEVLDVSVSRIDKLPNELTSFSQLKTLKLYYTAVDTLPSDIGRLQQLEYLDLRGTKIRTIPSSFTDLKKLKYLDLNEMKELTYIYSNFRYLTSLETLSMMNVPSLKVFPESIYELTNLKELSLSESDLKRWKLSYEYLQKRLPGCKIIVL